MPREDDKALLATYLRERVADAIESDYTGDNLEHRKVEFLLTEYAADATDAKRLSTQDGGIDAYIVDEDEDGNAVIHIWQLTGPSAALIEEGKVEPPPSNKLEGDVNKLVDALTKKRRRLSDDAADAVISITNAIDRAAMHGHAVTVNLHVLTLHDVPDSLRETVTELAEEKLKALVPNDVASSVRCVVHGLRQYAAAGSGVTGDGLSLDDLELVLAGGSAIAVHGDTYLAFVRPASLIEYYKKHGAALLYTNARFFLGKSKATAYRAISGSAKEAKAAKRFHELNNGLVVTCAGVTKKEGSGSAPTRLILSSPQVVNGGQTLHTLTEVTRLEAKRGRTGMKHLVLPVKIVKLENGSGQGAGATERAAQIAQASNTQAALSPRALASYAGVNSTLQHAFAKRLPRWFFEKTDGEWRAFRKTTPEHRRVIAGVTDANEFQLVSGKSRHARLLHNAVVLEALLAVYGCFEDATPARVFDPPVHPEVLNVGLSAAAWHSFAEETEPSRTFTLFKSKFNLNSDVAPQVGLFTLAWILFQSVRELSLPEKESRSWAMAFWSETFDAGPFEDAEAWLKFCESQADADALDGAEQVANAMQKPIMFEMLRLLARRYGRLDEATCARILGLPQFKEILEGQPVDRVLNASDCRDAKIGDPASPIYTLYQLCRAGCAMLLQKDGSVIRKMGTRQQELLKTDWVRRLSANVDALGNNVAALKMRLLPGVEYEATKLAGMLPDSVESSDGKRAQNGSPKRGTKATRSTPATKRSSTIPTRTAKQQPDRKSGEGLRAGPVVRKGMSR